MEKIEKRLALAILLGLGNQIGYFEDMAKTSAMVGGKNLKFWQEKLKDAQDAQEAVRNAEWV